MAEERSWLRENWRTPVLLLAIFLAALYLRAYFPWDLAVKDELLSGGSDSFYYRRIIDHIAETGTQLVFDPLLNFPTGLTNPRPPLYAWTTVVVGKALSPFFGDARAAISVVFLASTAVWGALTIFPLYFLTKEAFGRRSAILAAFFLAVLPAHLQRSPATNADHDAMVLFFVVTGFFFLLKSLKALHERRWAEDWSFWTRAGRASVAAGLRGFFGENRTAMLYATLAGWSLATIALTWQGWAYAPIILLVYFLFQILVHRFRNRDPMGILILFAIAMGLPLLVAFPWYFVMNQIQVWYDVPLYLYLAALGLGFVFTVTRDYPWALVVPVVFGVSGGVLFVLALVNPAVANAFVSGAGYFVRTKAFETIAEAQPPGLSQIILSFGVATYFLSLFGLVWMAYGVTKRTTPDYLFVVVWAIAAIFMAQAAARFIFNASPAFAMVSAWVTVLFIDWMRFDEMRRTFRSLSGARLRTALRRSIKARHVFGALLVVFVLILPNVWFAVDASIPFERKAEFDEQVYNAFPQFLRPPGYDALTAGGGAFYFGAFGYSLPLEREYFPAAWTWFRSQDADVHPQEARPAFLSWWDYGFEAVDVGDHPTVADNFLDGYHLAGNFITAQTEEEAIALLNLRLLEGDFRTHGRQFSPAARAVLDGTGLPTDQLLDAFRRPEAYVSVVSANPDRYRPVQNLQRLNALYIFAGEILTSRLDQEELASLNHALRKVVGSSIRYFAVDTRLFPIDGQNTGIFYAPSKLSDHRVLELPDGRTIPRDFFDIVAVTQRGEVNVEDLRNTDQVSDLFLRYKEMFYNSMFYRAYIGYPPQVAGQDCSDCIPGLGGRNNPQIANLEPLQAWNLSHFKLVYKTAYYNPFPASEVANHTDAWRAIDFFEAQDLQGKINRGEATGVVDLTAASTIRRGIVVVKYYDGAFVNGTVTVGGRPWGGVRLTVEDELDVPHHTAVTGDDGRFSVLVPFGQVKIVLSLGRFDEWRLVGSRTIHTVELNVSDAAAMRENVDADGNGVVDWLIAQDIDLPGEVYEGVAFLDLDQDGALDVGEPRIAGADLTLASAELGLTRAVRTAEDGRYRVESLFPSQYAPRLVWQGRTLTPSNITIGAGQGPANLAVTPTTIRGTVTDPGGTPVAGATVILREFATETVTAKKSDDIGEFAFAGILPGTVEIGASLGLARSLPSRAVIPAGRGTVVHNVTLHPSADVTVRTTLGGTAEPFVTLALTRRTDGLVRFATTDGSGATTFALPEGTWDVHTRHYARDALWAFVGPLTVAAGDVTTYPVILAPGAAIGGTVFASDNRSLTQALAEITFRGPAGEHRVRADFNGRYFTHLPTGTWTVQVSHGPFFFHGTRTVAADGVLDLPVARGVDVQGRVLRAAFGNATASDPVAGVTVRFSDGTRSFEATTAANGTFAIALPGEGRFAIRLDRAGFVSLEQPAADAATWRSGATFALVALNVTVSGTIRRDGAPMTDPSVPVLFEADGEGALTTQAVLDGAGGYAVSLAPGRYNVRVDKALSGPGDVRLQLRDDVVVSVPIGGRTVARNLDLTERARVSVTFTLAGQPRSPAVHFDGPDVVDTNATGGTATAFLAAGTYTLAATLVDAGDTYLALETINVAGPAAMNVSLRLATNVSGSVTDEGRLIGGVPIEFTASSGATIRTASDGSGQYHLFLLPDTYAMSVDHATMVTEGGGTRHVRYSFAGSLDVREGARFAILNLQLARALDNTTVSGTVRFQGLETAAQLVFTVRGLDGITGTTAAGSDGAYALALQPGSYAVYAVSALRGAAFLGPFELAPGMPATFDVTLEAAVRVGGTTSLPGNLGASANVTFTSSFGHTMFRSGPTGTYDVLLPAGVYAIDATAAGAERGVGVTYRTSTTAALAEPTLLNLVLAKVVRRSVEIAWDSAQRTEIAAGGAATYTVVIRNTGNADDTYVLTGSGSGFAFSLGRDRVSLPFGTGNETAVRVTITANADARVDHPPITVAARSEADTSVVRSVTLELDVRRFRGLMAAVSSLAPRWDGRFLNYTLEITNTGNGPETFRLTLPNLDELRATGWAANLVGPAGMTTELDLLVAANSTERPTLRLEKVGGISGTLARVHVVNVDSPVHEALVTVNIQMPSLSVDGPILAIGTGLSLTEPGLDVPTTAFLISLVAVVAAAAYLAILRRRSR